MSIASKLPRHTTTAHQACCPPHLMTKQEPPKPKCCGPQHLGMSHVANKQHLQDVCTQGRKITLKKVEVDHGDHQHKTWQAQSLARKLRDATTWKINQDQEGCPCCVAGLDFDEFAVAIKELKNASGDTTEQIAKLAEFNDGGHWGIFLGISAPLGLIGLTAAIRNVKGSGDNLKALKQIILGLSKDIERYKSQENTEIHQDIIRKLEAFKDTLQYSKFDSKFNVLFPGYINGAASTLVLSTAVVSHPFALPAIAMYATGQLARNSYDFKRNFSRKLPMNPQDAPHIAEGKLKVNQVHQSKQRFFAANGTGFAAFAVGAALTFASIPALSIGIGAVGLPLGLALLSTGALSTGIMNNIWPRKFRPRNGDLGIDRLKLRDQHHCLSEIQRRREHKKILATFGAGILTKSLWQKRFLKVLTAMPQFRDFMPKPAADWIDRVFPIFKHCGTAATAKKHRLNMEIIANAYTNPLHGESLDSRRVLALQQMTKTKPELGTTQTPLQQSWGLLGKLDLQADVLDIMLNEKFTASKQLALKHKHKYKHNDSGCCNSHHEDHTFAGLHSISDTEAEFDFDEFIVNASEEDKNKLRMSMDHHLYFVHRKEMQYQQYGLIDYMWSLQLKGQQGAEIKT